MWTFIMDAGVKPGHDTERYTSTFSAAMNAYCGMSTLPNFRVTCS